MSETTSPPGCGGAWVWSEVSIIMLAATSFVGSASESASWSCPFLWGSSLISAWASMMLRWVFCWCCVTPLDVLARLGDLGSGAFLFFSDLEFCFLG